MAPSISNRPVARPVANGAHSSLSPEAHTTSQKANMANMAILPAEVFLYIIDILVGENAHIEIREPCRCPQFCDCSNKIKSGGLMACMAVNKEWRMMAANIIFSKATFHNKSFGKDLANPMVGIGPLYAVYDGSMDIYTNEIQKLVSANYDERITGTRVRVGQMDHPHLFDKEFFSLRELSVHLPDEYRLTSKAGLTNMRDKSIRFNNYAWRQLLSWKQWGLKVNLEIFVHRTTKQTLPLPPVLQTAHVVLPQPLALQPLPGMVPPGQTLPAPGPPGSPGHNRYVDSNILVVLEENGQIWLRGRSIGARYTDVEDLVMKKLRNHYWKVFKMPTAVNDIAATRAARDSFALKNSHNIPDALKIVRPALDFDDL